MSLRACQVVVAAGLTIVSVACADSPAPTTTAVTTTVTTTLAPGTTGTSISPPTTSEAPATTDAATTSSPVPTTAATSTTAADTTTVEIAVADGQVSGPGRVTVTLGSTLVVTVAADVTDEVHLHGYDVLADVAPGQPAVLEVAATIPGVFEVELEAARLELVVIEVK